LIEFSPDGIVTWANQKFCSVMGYELEEIIGKHHRLFVDPAYADSKEYRAFWAKLAGGEYVSAEFKRFAKGGREVWLQASYNPVVNSSGKVLNILKQATDITAEALKAAETKALVNAISRAQAMIEFTPDGQILWANENFLNVMGYSLAEIQGKHHSMFVDPDYARTPAYHEFWAKLRASAFIADEFKRIGKNGREVYLLANYNPIFNLDGKVIKVVKIATNMTDHKAALVELGTGLRELAENHVGYRITKPFIAQHESLKLDFNASCGQLETAIRAIAQNASGVKTGAMEINQACDDLSRRTEQQAASLEQTAAALDQMTASVRSTATGVADARSLAAETKADAEHSGTVVGETVAAMSGIQSSSVEIGNIIGVIDDIAFQTNLLALNAGVEAARAGDAGRGFVVVATEVRGLAQRSADAAKQIKTLISASSQQVESGVKLVNETGNALHRIVDQVNRLNDLISAIAASVSEQATGLGEVNTAVNQMDQVTQQNAAMVEQSTAASNALAAEAADLANLVGQFRLGQKSAAAVPPRRVHDTAPSKPNRKPNPEPKPQPVRSAAHPAPAGAGHNDWDEF